MEVVPDHPKTLITDLPSWTQPTESIASPGATKLRELPQAKKNFAAAASRTLSGYLDTLPRQLDVLQQLAQTSQKFDEVEPLNATKMATAVTDLYQLDRLISEQHALFDGRSASSPRKALPNPKNQKETSVLFKSLLFTLPHQLRRVQTMMSAGHLSTLDTHSVARLLDTANKHKYEQMQHHCSNVMNLLAVMVKVPLAVAKFRAGGRRYHARNREVTLTRGFH
mmetsp:Transcript_68493/g.161024  ORF Transcript_68493/g.161024 Transcript_68493/m.161024 type:complete len:224 (+) Transcript_68493:1-672(+)